MSNKEAKMDVKSKIGTTVGTLWGPCEVMGLEKDSEGNDVAILSEDGELFTVKLSEWKESLM